MLTTSSIYFVASSSIPKTGETTVIGRMYVVCLLNGLIVILVGIITTSLVVINEDDLLSHSYLLEIFRRFDKDNSKCLELDEAKNALTELGVDEDHHDKCLLILDTNGNGVIELPEWLKISRSLTFNPKGAKMLARHHNSITGWLLKMALKHDREEANFLQWSKQTVRQDLLLILSERHASLAWGLLAQLRIAGNWTELKRTRSILKFSGIHASKVQRQISQHLSENEQTLAKMRFIAQVLVADAEEQARRLSVFAPLSNAAALLTLSSPLRREQSSRLESKGVIGQSAERQQSKQIKQHQDEQIEKTESLLVKILSGLGNPQVQVEISSIYLPRFPQLVDLNGWSAEELRDFLLNVEGDMCDKARFRKHAQRLADAEVDGACVKGFNSITAAECGVGVGDREHLVRGMKLLYRLYTQACRFRHEVKISVLSAQHLPKMDLYGSIDSYVRLDLENTKTGTVQNYITPVVDDSYDPVWKNAHATFHIKDLHDPGDLKVSVYDNDVWSQDDFVGAHLLGEVFSSLSVSCMYLALSPQRDDDSTEVLQPFLVAGGLSAFFVVADMDAVGHCNMVWAYLFIFLVTASVRGCNSSASSLEDACSSETFCSCARCVRITADICAQ